MGVLAYNLLRFKEKYGPESVVSYGGESLKHPSAMVGKVGCKEGAVNSGNKRNRMIKGGDI